MYFNRGYTRYAGLGFKKRLKENALMDFRRKNIIYLSLIILFNISGSGALYSVTESASDFLMDLNGTPVVLEEYKGKNFDDLTLNRKVFFNGGNIVSEEIFSPDGSLNSKIAYTYSQDGAVTGINGTDAADKLKWKYSYQYSEDGKLITETSYDGEENIEWIVFSEYDDTGKLFEQRTCNPDGNLTLKEVFTYDEYGRKKEQKSYYGDGKILKRIVFEYNDDGTVSREFSFDGNGLYETSVFSYTDKKVRTVKRFGVDGVLKDVQHKEYKNGLMIRSITTDSDGTEISREEFIYDNFDNIFCIKNQTGMTIQKITYGE